MIAMDTQMGLGLRLLVRKVLGNHNEKLSLGRVDPILDLPMEDISSLALTPPTISNLKKVDKECQTMGLDSQDNLNPTSTKQMIDRNLEFSLEVE